MYSQRIIYTCNHFASQLSISSLSEYIYPIENISRSAQLILLLARKPAFRLNSQQPHAPSNRSRYFGNLNYELHGDMFTAK